MEEAAEKEKEDGEEAAKAHATEEEEKAKEMAEDKALEGEWDDYFEWLKTHKGSWKTFQDDIERAIVKKIDAATAKKQERERKFLERERKFLAAATPESSADMAEPFPEAGYIRTL